MKPAPASSGTSGPLGEAEFVEMAELLRQLSRSRSTDVRRNAVVAWALMAKRTDNPQLQRSAVASLIDTALAQGEQTDGDVLVRTTAAEQLGALDRSLVNHAVNKLRQEIGLRNVDRARRAGELAIAVLSRRRPEGIKSRMLGWRLQASGYFALLRLSLEQFGLTLRDFGPVMIVLGLLAGVFFPVVLWMGAGVELTRLANLGGQSGIWLFMVGLVVANFAVPASALRGFTRLLDALAISLVAVAFVILLTAMGFQVSDQRGEGVVPFEELISIFIGIFAARLSAHLLSSAASISRIAVAALGGSFVGSTLVLLLYFRLPKGAYDLWWFIWAVVTAAMIGAAWGDYRRGTASARIEDSVTIRMLRRATAVAALGAVLGFGTAMAHVSQAVFDVRSTLVGSIKAKAVRGNWAVPCQVGARLEIPDVQPYVYYEFQSCPNLAVEISSIAIPLRIYHKDEGSVDYHTGVRVLNDFVEDPYRSRLGRAMRESGSVARIEPGSLNQTHGKPKAYICLEHCEQISRRVAVWKYVAVAGQILAGRTPEADTLFASNEDELEYASIAMDAAAAATEAASTSDDTKPNEYAYAFTIEAKVPSKEPTTRNGPEAF